MTIAIVSGCIGIVGVILGTLLGFLLTSLQDWNKKRSERSTARLRLKQELNLNLQKAQTIVAKRTKKIRSVPLMFFRTQSYHSLYSSGNLTQLGYSQKTLADLDFVYIVINDIEKSLEDIRDWRRAIDVDLLNDNDRAKLDLSIWDAEKKIKKRISRLLIPKLEKITKAFE